MARPPEDPRVTDLRRYKKARDRARRQPPPRPQSENQPILGPRKHAGRILLIFMAVLLALYLVPLFLSASGLVR